MPGRSWMFCGCVGQGTVLTKEDVEDSQGVQHPQPVPYEPIKLAEKGSADSRQAMLYVRMAGTSDGDSQGGTDSSSSHSDSNASSEALDTPGDAPEVWHDCEESQEWCQAGDAEAQQGVSSSTAPTAATSAAEASARLTEQQVACLQALPTRLCGLLTQYLQGGSVGCKPLVAVMRYMQNSSTSLPQLQELLQPLLEAEQDLPPQLPAPIPHVTPAERTAELRRQLQDLQQARHNNNSTNTTSSSSDSAPQAPSSSSPPPQQQQQYGQPRVAHLLRNLQLAHESLATMDRQEGFKQVAHGPLQLWYCHDAAAKCQIIRARVVLEEPLSAIATVTREFDLVPSWNAGMADMRELAGYSPTELLVYNLPWMPWPLPQPEMLNYCFAADLLELQQRCVLFHMSSTEAPAGIEVPKRSRTIPVHINPGGFRMVPLPPSPDKPDTPRTEVTVLVSLDATRFVVPDHIISIILRVFAPVVHKSTLGVFSRMFHQAMPAAAAAPPAPAGKAAAAAASQAAAHSSPSVCSGSMLRERLALRPEYAALDAHVARFLAAAGVAAAAGPARPLEL